VKLYTQAAERGRAQAQVNLGYCYEKGIGCVQDDARAARLFRQAAEQGDAHGQHMLGDCYCKGAGVEQDFALVVRLYTLAANQGFARAQSSFGKCCVQGFGMAHDIADAARYFLLAADQGDATAQCLLGFLCEHGKGTKRDLGEAVRLYRAAAAQRDVRALARLGVCLEKGRGVAQSEAEAAASYAAASELGAADALFDSGAEILHLAAVRYAAESELVLREQSARPESLQLAVSELALATRLGHAEALGMLASLSSRREVASACCMGCGATRKLQTCAKCRIAAFCDRECQMHTWEMHKPCCKQWRDEGSSA